jgi:hypothetical protein
MTLNEYIPLAVRTESPHKVVEDLRANRLLHATMGLCTEAAELVETTGELNTKEELGDLCWYAAIILDELHTMDKNRPGMDQPASTFTTSHKVDQLVVFMVADSGSALDALKKHLFYRKELNPMSVLMPTYRILDCIKAIATVSGYSISDIYEANIRKLQHRYPEKFTEDAANNRDLAGEMKALS